MKKIAALFSVVVMLSQGSFVFSQSMSTPVVDSIYLKKSGSIAGSWLSTRTLQNIGVRTSDTITRTKLMTRKATDSLYLKTTANRIKGTGAAGQVAWFATSDSVQGTNQIKVVTTSGVNNLVLSGINNGSVIPSVGASNNLGLVFLGNVPNGSGAAALVNTNTTTSTMNGFTFGQYTGASTITNLARITGMSISTAPIAGSLVLSGRMIAGIGSGLGANASTYELDINGRGRVTGTFRVGGAINDTTNYNHEFDGRTSTLTIRPRVDNTTAIQFTNSAKTLKPLVINTNNGRAYRNSVATDSMYTVKKDNDLLYLKLSDTVTRTKVLTRKAADSLYGGGGGATLVTAGSTSVGAVKYNGRDTVKNGNKGMFFSPKINPFTTDGDSMLAFNGYLSSHKPFIYKNSLDERYPYTVLSSYSDEYGVMNLIEFVNDFSNYSHSVGLNRYGGTIFTDTSINRPSGSVFAACFNAAEGNKGGSIVAIGDIAAGYNTGHLINALGPSAAEGNSGSYLNALGPTSCLHNTGSHINAFGDSVATDNTGSNVNGFGKYVAVSNSGSNVNAFSPYAAYYNSGSNINAFSPYAAYRNSGSHVNAIGYLNANYNKADTLDLIGYHAGYHNASNAHSSVGIGKRANMYNNWPSRVTIGGITNPVARFIEAPYTTKTFTNANVNTSNNRITITSHGFGSTNSYINLKFKVVSGTAPSGLVNNGIYFFKVIDNNTLELTDGTISSTGSGTFSLTRDVDRTSSVELGSGAIADTSYQVMLGNTSMRQVKTYGSFATEKGKITVNGSTSGSAQFVMPFDGGSYKKVIIYCNALNGTASWTFPTPFTYTPVVLQTSGLPTTIVTTLTTTSVTVTGANSTGFLIIEGY